MKILSMIRKYVKKKYKIINHCKYCEVKKVFDAQYINSVYQRMDIVVRLLAIENEYGLNNYGWYLYQKMQAQRCKNKNASISIDDRIEKFRKLIDSWQKNGYNQVTYLTIDKNKRLVDGSHRIALCLYHNVKEIKVYVYKHKVEHCDYSIRWFKNNGFNDEEISKILDRYDKLLLK